MSYFEESYLPEADVFIPQLADVDIGDYDFQTHDIYATMLSMVPALVEKARNGAKSPYYTASYRGFCVGASALVYDTNPGNPRIATYTAGNYKARLRDEERGEEDVADIPKFCAEMDITMRATNDDLERIGVYVVAATTNRQRIAAVTDIASATLPPCGECVGVLKGSPLVDKDTIIMSVGSGNDIYQVQSFDQLSRRYKAHAEGKQVPDLSVQRYSSYDWEDRKTFYLQERRRQRIKYNVYSLNKTREIRCRKLAALAMAA